MFETRKFNIKYTNYHIFSTILRIFLSIPYTFPTVKSHDRDLKVRLYSIKLRTHLRRPFY